MQSKNLNNTIKYLKNKNKILFLTTSNRWSDSQEIPKSTQLANHIAEKIGLDKVSIIDITKLKIYPCEGNVSSISGNNCGVKKSLLENKEKNPSGLHRCWASINNPDDELWKISKQLFESDAVVFFVSVRWGQTNAYYQKLIERLTWIENIRATLKESNIVENIDSGIIVIGHNWRVKEIIETQKSVFKFFGFKTPKELFWGYQFTKNKDDETLSSYKKTIPFFEKIYGFILNKTVLNELKLSIKKFLKL